MAECANSSELKLHFTPGTLPAPITGLQCLGALCKKLLGNKKYVLIDLSGTLHIEDEPTHDAVDSLRRLRDAGLKIKFVTNTSKESKQVLYEKLKRIGFDISIDEIFTSMTAAADYLKRNGLKANLLIDDCAVEDFNGIEIDEEKPDAVVIGLAPSKFNYETLNKAFEHIQNGAKLIALHKGKYFAKKRGNVLGPGPFVASLEFATGKKAEVIGKPSRQFYLSALKELSCEDPREAVMIGDGITEDVLGSIDVGITGILVKTGKYVEGDELKIPAGKPHFVAKDFSGVTNVLLLAKAAYYRIDYSNSDLDQLAFLVKAAEC